MTDDKFFERLRDDAAQLRYAPQDGFVWTRIAARIRARLHTDTEPDLSALAAEDEPAGQRTAMIP